MDPTRGKASALSLVALMVMMSLGPMASIVSADDVPWTGPGSMILDVATVEGFNIETNGTVTDAWVTIDSDGSDIFTSSGWESDIPGKNFSHGLHHNASSSLFNGDLSLSNADNHGRIHDFENLHRRFEGWIPGGTTSIWEITDVSSLNGTVVNINNSVGQSMTARTNGGGHAPRFASDGNFVAMTQPDLSLTPGTHSWLTGPNWAVPTHVENLTFTMDHWFHLWTDSDDAGTGAGAWVEVSFDGGLNWSWIEPEQGYGNTISTTAPIPNGANGSGFPAWASVNASGWVRSSFVLDEHPQIVNASTFRFRLVVWTPITQSIDRPGWFVDRLHVSNDGYAPGAWFHGNLNGEYAADANAALVMEADLSSVTGPMVLQYAADFDMEGDIYDNWHVEMSTDGINWTGITPLIGLPGHGVYVNGTTIIDDSNGWVSLQHAIPNGYNTSVSLRFRFQSDPTGGTGFGGLTIDPPEGLMLDDVRIIEISGQTEIEHAVWRFNDTSNANHSAVILGKVNQWRHISNQGMNGPWSETQSFEDASLLPMDWNIVTEAGYGWSFGELNNTGPDPSSFPGGGNGAGTLLNAAYRQNSYSHLESPSIPIPYGSRATLRFDHFICAESGWDGGALYISTDHGHSWSHFGSHIVDWYDSMHYNNTLSPFYGQMAWDGSRVKGGGCGTNTSFVTKTADMSHLAGQSVMLRFSFFSDTYFESSGWYVDNVGITVDVFREKGTWTSPLIQAPDSLGWGSVDVQGSVPNRTAVKATILDSQGLPILGMENRSLPVHLADLYGLTSFDSSLGIHIRIEMETMDEHRTPRIQQVTINGSRFLSGQAASSTGWAIASPLIVHEVDGRIENPTFMTHRVDGPTIISERRIESFYLESISAGVMIEVFADGISVHSSMINNGTISLFRPATTLAFVLDFQPGSDLEVLSIHPHLTTPSFGPEIDILSDDFVEWSWPDDSSGNALPYGLTQGLSLESNSSSINGSIQMSLVDDADWRSATMMLRAHTGTDVTVTINLGQRSWTRTMSEGDFSMIGMTGAELRQGQSSSVGQLILGPSHQMPLRDVVFQVTADQQFTGSVTLLSVDQHIISNISNLGPSIENYRLNEISDAAFAGLNVTSKLPIPVQVKQEDGGGLILDGHVIQSPLMTDEILLNPTTIVPGISFDIVTEHHHLFDVDEINRIHLELHMSGISPRPSFILNPLVPESVQTIESSGFTIGSPSVEHRPFSYRITWPLTMDWSLDDAEWVKIHAKAFDSLNRTWGPDVSTIGIGGLNGIENDMEIVGFTVVDSLDRSLMDPSVYGYPLHLSPLSPLEVSGQVRFEGIVGDIPESSAAVAVMIETESHNWSFPAGPVATDGSWSATIAIPDVEVESSESVWNITARLIRVGPAQENRNQALDNTLIDRPGQFRIDRGAPIIGRLLADISGIQRPLDQDIWSLTRPLVMSVEVDEVESLSRTIQIHSWIENTNDLNGDGIPQPDEYNSRPIAVPFNAHEIGNIDLGLLDISMGDDGAIVSIYLTGVDASGRTFIGGGGPGLHADLASFSLAEERPTRIERNEISMDHIDGSLLYASTHTVSIVVEDENGFTSIDEIHLWLSGDGEEAGHLLYRPLLGELFAPTGSSLIPMGSEFIPIDASENRGLLNLSFAIGEKAPFEWTLSSHVPSITVIEDERTLDLDLLTLADLTWSLDHRTSWQVIEVQDLTAPFGRIDSGVIHAWDGDAILCRLQIVHERNGVPLSAPPVGREVSVDPHFDDNLETTPGVIVNGTVDENGIVEFVVVLPQMEIDSDGVLRVRLDSTGQIAWGSRDIDVVVDRTAPRIEFLQTSLAAVQTNSLETQQVSFSILDEGGVAEKEIDLHWTFRRFGVDLPGSVGYESIGPVQRQGLVYGVSESVDISTINPKDLEDGDQLVVWLTFTDLAGNPVEGLGSQYEPRAPVLRVVWFEPKIEPISVDPQPAHLNRFVDVDLWIRDTGNQGGSVEVSLLAWRQDGPIERWIEQNRTTIQLMPGGSVRESFEVETWAVGQMLLLAVLDGDIENGTVLPAIEVIDPDAQRGFLDSVVEGDLNSIGLLVIVFTGFGFLIGIIVQRNPAAEDWDDDEDDIPLPETPPARPKSWPSPPDRFPDDESEE